MMTLQYVQVVENEGDEAIELPTEEDGTLLLTTVSAQFPGSCGLKYRNAESGNLRGIRIQDGKLFSPEDSWGSHLYYVVFPKDSNKRKGEALETSNAKVKKPTPPTPTATSSTPSSTPSSRQKCTDLIVLGLPYSCEKEELQTYFEQFGEVLMAEIKKDPRSGKSKGFGFIRFGDTDSQTKSLNQRHMIGGRWCDVKMPLSKEGPSGVTGNRKIFIGRCAEDINAEDLRNYFSKYGEVIDVFIPKPYRAFAFVTFADPYVAKGLCGEDHIIKGSSVHVSSAEPKNPEKRPYYDDSGYRGGSGGGASRYDDGYGRYDDGYGYGDGNYGNNYGPSQRDDWDGPGSYHRSRRDSGPYGGPGMGGDRAPRRPSGRSSYYDAY